jgi:hypothetical protein
VIGFINTYDSQSYDTNGSPRKHMPVEDWNNFLLLYWEFTLLEHE